MIKLKFQRSVEVTPDFKEGKYKLGVIDLDRKLLIGAEENFDKPVTFDYKYFMNLQFVLVNKETGEQKGYTMQPLTETCVIEIHSKALGDQIAWIPFVSEFQKKHKCKVVVRCHFPELFESSYKNLTFLKQHFKGTKEKITGESIISQATYCLGYDVTGKDTEISPVDCRTIPLQHVAAYQLGLEPRELQCTLKSNIKKPIVKGRYVVISTGATANFKLWNNPKGFPTMVKYFLKKGYKVIDVGDSTDSIKGTTSMNGFLEWNELINILKHAQLFLSATNGLMWASWGAQQKNIVTINGTTARGNEFEHYKIDNKDECRACWHDTAYVFENDNVNYCPRNQNYICSSSITPETVIKVIEKNKLC